MTVAALEHALRSAVRALRGTGAPHAVIGALARGAWSHPRATTDVDFAIACEPRQWPHVVAALAEAGLELIAASPAHDDLPSSAFFGSAAGIRVDLLVAHTPFEEQAIGRRVEATIAGETTWVVTPEDLVVYKLIAGRPRDLDDIAAVLGAVRGNRPFDGAYVRSWAHEWGVGERLAPFEPLPEDAAVEP